MATYAVFGLGKSGLATVEYLTARGDKVFAWDDNENTIRHCESLIEPKNWNWNKIEALILAPGIPLTHPKPHPIVNLAHQHHKKIICDIELLWRDNRAAKFIGITGTNGKSTTTALIGHILQANNYDAAIGGNLGTAALTLGKHKYYVLELSSYQLDLIDQAKFDIAIWLNISPDHLDRHGDINGYVKAKKNIFKNGNVTAIVGVDDEISQSIYNELAHPALDAGPHEIPHQVRDVQSVSKEKNLGDFPLLPGQHNQQNINAAYEAAKAIGIPHQKIIAAIKTFPGLAHRIQNVAEINGVKFINDSKATNADSTANALAAFDNIYWILGGVPKAGGITSLASYFPKIKKAYLIGQAADEFAATLDGKVLYVKSGTLQSAVTQAAQDASSGVILLSPACASFDQFKNFEERGDKFKELVSQLSSSAQLGIQGFSAQFTNPGSPLREDDKGVQNG